MRTIGVILILTLLVNSGFTQSFPTDSLYLGQTVPSDIPKIFKLQVSSEHFAAERITISHDNREIYFSEINSYYPTTSAATYYYRFTGDKWMGPILLFEDYCAPALSVNGDSMYLENDNFETFISVKNGRKWSVPKRILTKIDSAHYMQATKCGNYYISSKPANSIGLGDWCKLDFTSSDTIATGLGVPLNTAWDNLDFFVSSDESFMILTSPWGLSISYPKNDGGWTNPRNLGTKINFGLGMWGPFVTTDNKCLFYTSGTKQDYSDVNVYWVRVDGLIDSLKHTNSPPYLKIKLKNQSAITGELLSIKIPDNSFFDEDGETSFIYSATLLDGSPLPSWLDFDLQTKTFSGTPTEAGIVKIALQATDAANDSGLAVFKITITDQP